jgi:predicted RNA-binding Zn-ribbon protein involved in translation (DUF1610 family)
MSEENKITCPHCGQEINPDDICVVQEIRRSMRWDPDLKIAFVKEDLTDDSYVRFFCPNCEEDMMQEGPFDPTQSSTEPAFEYEWE